MSFGQLTNRESISDTMMCLKANAGKMYHLGFSQPVAVSTLTRANESRSFYASKDYPEKMRRIKFKDDATGKVLIFLTNNFHLKATEIAQLYIHR